MVRSVNGSNGQSSGADGGNSYTVVKGDTMWEIAQRQGVSLSSLIKANPQIKNPNLIFPGQAINIPAGGGGGGRLSGLNVNRGVNPGDRPSRGGGAGEVDGIAPSRVGGSTPWLNVAKGELGVHEVAGAGNNSRVLAYHATTGGFGSDEVPWCSSFVNWVMKQSGIKGTNNAMARSWLNWGQKLDGPKEGAVVIFSRGSSPTQGHVGIVVGEEGGYLKVLGGNQSDQVKVSLFPKSQVLGYRWPA